MCLIALVSVFSGRIIAAADVIARKIEGSGPFRQGLASGPTGQLTITALHTSYSFAPSAVQGGSVACDKAISQPLRIQPRKRWQKIARHGGRNPSLTLAANPH
jgi:hypothetical protein